LKGITLQSIFVLNTALPKKVQACSSTGSLLDVIDKSPHSCLQRGVNPVLSHQIFGTDL